MKPANDGPGDKVKLGAEEFNRFLALEHEVVAEELGRFLQAPARRVEFERRLGAARETRPAWDVVAQAFRAQDLHNGVTLAGTLGTRIYRWKTRQCDGWEDKTGRMRLARRENDRFARCLVRHGARLAIAREWSQVLEREEGLARSWLEAQTKLLEQAREFVAKNTNGLDPTKEDLDALAYRLVCLCLEDSAASASVGSIREATEANLGPVWLPLLEEWKKARRPAPLARIPVGFVAGDGAFAPIFGRTLPAGTRVVPKSHDDGRVHSVKITRRNTQLDLLMPLQVTLQNPSNKQVLYMLAKILSNREWRLLLAVLVAASEDFEAGHVPQPGGFLYTPGRFSALLGLSDRESTRKLDHSLEALMGLSVTATMKRGGKDFRFVVESLVVDGMATLTPTDQAKKRGRGRPSARLYRIQDHIMALLDEGGAWFPVTKEMLRPPRGVDPRTWDDCFKLETVMVAYARLEPGKAKNKGTSLPWARKASMLLEASGMTCGEARPHVKLQRLRELLSILNDTGRVVAEYDDQTKRVRYNLPKIGPVFCEIPQVKRLQSLGGAR
jgi:hypothetical protein